MKTFYQSNQEKIEKDTRMRYSFPNDKEEGCGDQMIPDKPAIDNNDYIDHSKLKYKNYSSKDPYESNDTKKKQLDPIQIINSLVVDEFFLMLKGTVLATGNLEEIESLATNLILEENLSSGDLKIFQRCKMKFGALISR